MRLLPGSLGAQLVLLMFGGFVVGNLIGTLGLWSQAGALHPIAREHALSRTVTAYRLAHRETLDDDEWLDAFNTAVAHLWIDRVPNTATMDEREQALAQDIRTRLSAAAVTVRMPCRTAPGRNGLSGLKENSAAVECVEIDLALGDGRWLHTRQALPVQSLWQESWQLLRFSLLVGIPPVLILMYIFVNRILRPTTALTSAAERMSRGERIDPLSVQGPDEIREIAVAFNEMHERITRFVDERTRMLAAISHDLRTPLTALELQAVMLPESEERSEMLRTLEELRQMVSETLHFATQNARAEASTPADLVALLGEVCGHHLTLGRDVELQAPAALSYRCRPLALKRALNNLIENALRHGRQVQVRLSDRAAQGVRIEIVDDGLGIPDAMLERVFEPFFQLDEARHREFGSSVGLGLAIARDCIQAHGGCIRLRNRDGGGLLATIDLP
ncbi:HAMP domain-containing protein [Xanthomonas sp. Kuri4-1]